MLDAIARIRRATGAFDLEQFREDEVLIDAVLHNLAILGEATRHLPQNVLDAFPHIPWAEIRDMRDVLIHEYFRIDTDMVWRTVTFDLPELESALRQILSRVD